MGSKHQLIKLTLTKSKCCLLVGVDRDNFKRNRKILPFAGCESVEKSSQAVATLWTPQAYDVVGLRILEFSSMSISTKPFSIRPFLVFAKRVIFIDFVSVQFWHTNTNHLFKKKIYTYILLRITIHSWSFRSLAYVQWYVLLRTLWRQRERVRKAQYIISGIHQKSCWILQEVW